MSASEFQIQGHTIGDTWLPFIIAEAGVHHYNSLELAKLYIAQARLAGADAIKFQTYKAERIAARWAPTYWNDNSGRTQYDIFSERDHLQPDDYRAMIEYANRVGIIFLSTPFDPDSAALLNEIGMPAFKIASADITNLPLLRRIATFGKPLILSTGASTFDEIHTTVDQLQRFDIPLSLLHCTLTYPTSLSDANLSRIQMLHREFPNLVIGYSDHTQPQDSEIACPLSIAMGARIVEKHFTLNKTLLGDDHYHAVDYEGLVRLVKNCREAFIMTQHYVEISESERSARMYARRSIVAVRELQVGEIISIADIDFKRPGTGLPPGLSDHVVGKRVICNIAPDELISEQNVALA